MVFKKKKDKEESPKKRQQFVVQIREVLDNKKFGNSVTKYIGKSDAEKIYNLLEK